MSTRTARVLTGRTPWLAVAVLTLLAAVLRFATLDLQSFWSDEAMTVLLLRTDLIETLRAIAQTEATPPVYYLVAWVWTRIFGDGEVGLRSLSAVAGTLTVPVAYLAASELFGRRRAAVGAAALVAVSPALVWYSQEARSYALAVLLCAASFAAFGRVLAAPSRNALALWTALSLLAFGTHYFAFFVVAAEAVWLLATRRSRPTLMSVLAVGVGGAALLPLALTQRGHGFVESLAGADSERLRIAVLVKQLLVGEFLPYDRLVATVVAVFLAVPFVFLVVRAGPRTRHAVVVAVTVGGAPIVLPLLLAVAGHDYLNTRNALVGYVPLAVAVGGVLACPGSRSLGPVVLVGASAALFAVSVVATTDPSLSRPDWRGLTREVRAGTSPQALVVKPDHQGWFARVPLQVYFPDAHAVDARYTEAPSQFKRVSRRPVDRRTPRDIVVREVVLAGVDWSIPELARGLPRTFEPVEERRAHGYSLVRYVSVRPARVRTSDLSSPQTAVLLAPHARR